MSPKRDLVTEIEEIRARTGPSDWDNGITKLLFLCTRVKELKIDAEEHAYYIVACVAALQVYFRWEIRNLIDSGDAKYARNIRDDELALRIDRDLLLAVHGQRVTIGDLVSHAVKLNDLDAVNRVIGQMLNADFFDLVRDARDPEERRAKGENAPPLIHSFGDLIEKVKRTFHLRHIICHEAHLRSGAGLDEIKEMCCACYRFARASRYAIAYYVDPNAPLTLDEAYKATVERVKVLKDRLNGLEELVLSRLGRSPTADAFTEMQRVWKLSVEKQAGFDASHHMNGNRGALYEQSTIEGLYKKRVAELEKYTENYGDNSVN